MRNDSHNRSKEAAKRAAYLRGKLLEKRQALLENMVSGFRASQDVAENQPSDLADMANAAITRETTCEIGSVESNAVTEIDHALEKLDRGTYGVCEECGRPIGEARLRVLPFASLCVDCKSQLEREEHAEQGEPLSWLDLGEEESRVVGEAESTVADPGDVRGVVRGRRPS